MDIDIRQLLEDFKTTLQYKALREYQRRRASEESGNALMPVSSASGHPLFEVLKQEYSKGRASGLEDDDVQNLIDELKLEAKKEQKK